MNVTLRRRRRTFRGEPYGPELLTNGTFATDTDWTKGGDWVISGGVASNPVGGGQRNLVSVADVVTPLVTYRVTFDILNYVAGAIEVYAGLGGTGYGTGTITANGSYEFTLIGGTSDAKIYVACNDAFGGSIDNISVREVL
jgi:hypothetical protein